MILPTYSTIDQAKTFGLTVSQLWGSNDLVFTQCPDTGFADFTPLTPDGKAFLALVEEERVAS